MARLYDRIMAGTVPTGIESGAQLRDRVANVPIVTADNVADYFFQTKGTIPGGSNTWNLLDFPNVAPPHPEIWVEFRHSVPWGQRHTGVFFSYDQVGPGWREEIPDGSGEDVTMEDGGWLVHAIGFSQDNKQQIDTLAEWKYAVHLNGVVATVADGPFVLSRSVHHMFEHAEEESPGKGRAMLKVTTRQVLYPALLAISFMHCKNVRRREVAPPAPLDKKWRKKHGRPLVRYHVLDIDPMRKVLKTEGRSDEVGLKKALHICRGHFATYTEDAPLFGRITGTFWRPQHVRGSAKHGAVVKDYNVKAPAARGE